MSWFESRPESEIPKEYLWDDAEGLDLWWKLVAERSGLDAGGADQPGEDLVANELAREFKDGI